MEDSIKSDNGTLRTAGGGGSRAPPILCLSVKYSNRTSPRSVGGGGIVALRMMDECKGVINASSWKTKAEAEMKR